jgi:hypothetical protein
MRSKVLIIGNKKYKNLNISKLVDSDYFDEIYRCNLGLPSSNTGSRYGCLAMCNHMYEFFINKSTSLKRIIEIYKEDFETEFIINIYDRFKKEKQKFDKVYYQPSSMSACNKYLSKYNNSPKFKAMPRTGYALMIKLLNENKDVFVFGFTTDHEETRESYGVIEGRADKSPCHSKKEEIEVLTWLHKNAIIDASLCYLLDEKLIKFNQQKKMYISKNAKQIQKKYEK